MTEHHTLVSTTTLGCRSCNLGPGAEQGAHTPSVVAYALLVPSGIFLLAFTYWPVLQVALSSLTIRAFDGAAHWALDNYARLFADPHFAQALCNNLVYACGTIVPSLTLALLFALGLRETTRFAALLRT